MSYFIEVDYQRLLDFANGYTISGQTITKSPVIIYDVGPALTYVAAQGWTIVNIVGQPGRITYYLTASAASNATNTGLPTYDHEGEMASPTTITTETVPLTGTGNIPG